MKKPAILLALLFAGCGDTASLTDTTGEAPPVVLMDESAALDAIRDIRDGQAAFMATRRRYAQFLEELVDTRMILSTESWAESGYEIRIRPTPAADGYSATATAPADADARSFYVDDSGVVRWATGMAATSESPPLEGESTDGDDAGP